MQVRRTMFHIQVEKELPPCCIQYLQMCKHSCIFGIVVTISPKSNNKPRPATTHCLKQCWPNLLTHLCIIPPRNNKLMRLGKTSPTVYVWQIRLSCLRSTWYLHNYLYFTFCLLLDSQFTCRVYNAMFHDTLRRLAHCFVLLPPN